MGTKRFRSVMGAALPYILVTLVTLVLLDLVLMMTGSFPPENNHGHPVVGWVSAQPSGKVELNECQEFSTGQVHTVRRNEDGFRSGKSADELSGMNDLYVIAVTGDSHTDLCAPNEQTHFGFMESALNAGQISAATFAYGAGRYSPLQAYLAIRDGIEKNSADALVLNFYTGNDFHDMFRIDDRPYFEADSGTGLDAQGSDYTLADPIWYNFDPPGSVKRSRVLYAANEVLHRTGVEKLRIRLHFLYDTARTQGKGLPTVFNYMNDLRSSMAPEVGYPAAFSAQILNQVLFFNRFPGSAEESLRRVAALLTLIREQHPDLLLVMSPIPSYQLANEVALDQSFIDVMDKLPLSVEESRDMERELYEELKRLSIAEGWLFVDNLPALKAYRGDEPLYNDFDYHITPVASEIIGLAQADIIAGQGTGTGRDARRSAQQSSERADTDELVLQGSE